MTRTALFLAAAAFVLGGSAPLPAPTAIVSLPAYEEPVQRWTSVEEPAAAMACERRIEEARAAAGQPKLERQPADASRPILHYAVDRSIEGCAVMVPVGDPGAVEPMPKPAPGRPMVIPAR